MSVENPSSVHQDVTAGNSSSWGDRLLIPWEWYRVNFLTHYLYYLPLFLAVVAVVALLTGRIVTEFGIGQLVWHDDPLKRFFVAFGLTITFLTILFVGYLVWLRDRRRTDGQQFPVAVFEEVGFWEYGVRICVCLLSTLGSIWAVVRLVSVVGLGEQGSPLIAIADVFLYWAVPMLLAIGLVSPVRSYLARHSGRFGRLLFGNGNKRQGAVFLSRSIRILLVTLSGWAILGLTQEALPLALGVTSAVVLLRLLGQERIAERLTNTKLGRFLASRPSVARDYINKHDLPSRNAKLAHRIGVSLLATIWCLILFAAWDGPSLLGLVLAVLGAGLTLLGYFRRDCQQSYFFSGVLVVQMLILYIGITWLTSFFPNLPSAWRGVLDDLAKDGWLSVIVGLGVPVWTICFAGIVFLSFPAGFAWLLSGRKVRREDPDSLERINRRQAFWAIVLGLPAWVVLCSAPEVASPILTGAAFLWFIATVYGLFCYCFPRALASVVLVGTVLAVISGLQMHKYRHPDPLKGYYGESLGRPDHPGPEPLDLSEAVRNDWINLQKANPALRQYLATADESGGEPTGTEIKKELAALDEIERELKSKLPLQEDSLREIAQKRDRLQKKLGPLRDNARKAFLTLEQQNKVLLGRWYNEALADPTLRISSQETDELALLHTEDIKFNRDYSLQNAPQVKKKPLMIVAVSGGASLSAAWTLTVLHELERRCAQSEPYIDFPSHVRIITGASGGMVGAAYYVATLDSPAERRKKWQNGTREAEMEEQYSRLTQDCITPLGNQFVFGDIANLCSPWPLQYDRGRALEDAWSKHLEGKLDTPLASLAGQEREGWCPSLVFTPMMVEDGRRLILSNLETYPFISNGGALLSPDHELVEGEEPGGVTLEDLGLDNSYSIEALQLFRMFQFRDPGDPKAKSYRNLRKNFKLSTAVRMNATFPLFSPAVSLPTTPRRRVVDAGYYDNYGISFASAWLFSNRNRDWLVENVSKVVVIQVRGDLQGGQRRMTMIDGDGSSFLSRSVEQLSSPLEGLNNARTASSSFRNDGQLELLQKYIGDLLGRDHATSEAKYFTVVDFEFPGESAMNWYLSSREKKALRLEHDPDIDESKLNARKQAIDERITKLITFYLQDSLQEE